MRLPGASTIARWFGGVCAVTVCVLLFLNFRHLGAQELGPVEVSGDVGLTMATRTAFTSIPGHPVLVGATLAELRQQVEAVGGHFIELPQSALNAEREGKSAFIGVDLNVYDSCQSVTDVQTRLDRKRRLVEMHATISRICIPLTLWRPAGARGPDFNSLFVVRRNSLSAGRWTITVTGAERDAFTGVDRNGGATLNLP